MDCNLERLVCPQVYADAKAIADYPLDWDRLAGKTVMITGANGFITYYLVLALMIRNDLYHNNIKIMGVVRNQRKAEQKYGDVAEREDLALYVQDVCAPMDRLPRADFVIHAASQATPYFFENDPFGTLDANTTGTVNVLNYAKEGQSEAVLVISSLKVYGTVKNGAPKLTEETLGALDIDDYKNCYAQGKRTAETLCACFHKQYGVSVKLARPSYIYGASTMEDDRVWAQFLANIIRRQDILLKSNGAAYRSFCYVTDTVTALLTILLEGKDVQPYNIASEISDTTIRNFAKTAVRVFPEREMKLAFANKGDEAEPAPPDNGVTPEILDSAKLEALGWKAEVSLEEGIRRAVLTMEQR